MDALTVAAVLSLRPAPDMTAVILAGGESTRFGPGREVLVTPDRGPLIRRVVGTLRVVAGRPSIVAVRTVDQREHLTQVLPRDWNVRFVHDDPGLSRPLVGVIVTVDTIATS